MSHESTIWQEDHDRASTEAKACFDKSRKHHIRGSLGSPAEEIFHPYNVT